MPFVDIVNHETTALGLWDTESVYHVARGMGGEITLDPSSESIQVIDLLSSIGSITVTPTAAPVCTRDPEISGVAEVGETLTLDPGDWTGADSFAYRWEIDGEEVEEETELTLVVPVDSSGWVTAVVVATGPGGTTEAETDQYGPVGAE